MTYVLLLFGFVVLILSANWFVDSAVSIARRMRVSNTVIGLTIVAFGTSLPELIINLFAGFNGNSDLAVGNVLGSNISNILLILGITAVVLAFPVRRNTFLVEVPFSLIAVIVLWFFVNDTMLFGKLQNELHAFEGIIMLFLIGLFVFYSSRISKVSEEENSRMDVMPADRTGALFGLGLIGLWFGGKLIIDNAVLIAQMWGMSDMLIGLTILALGTSLPELATSVAAVMKGKPDLSMGNILGSNIFNIFFVLGIGSVVNPIAMEDFSNIDIYVTMAASIVLFLLIAIGKDRMLTRWKGFLLIGLYLLYMYYLIKRG